MKSTLFLQSVTSIDHAIITPDGSIQGGSYNASFEVTGDIEPIEAVVVDFGAIKKKIKGIIDDKENGWDHKLWNIRGISNVVYIDTGQVFQTKIITRFQTLTVPSNAVKTFDLDGGSIGDAIGKEVEKELRILYPQANISIVCYLDQTPLIPKDCTTYAFFTYTHGLKQSSSWGCQNIAHGHYSYIGAQSEKEVDFSSILNDIDGVNFIWEENVEDIDGLPGENIFTLIKYKTKERGYFDHSFITDRVKHIITPKETTIENLVEWVRDRYGDSLRNQGAKRLFLSEGLIKGSVLSL